MTSKGWILVLLVLFNGKIPEASLAGKYRLAYYPEIKKYSGWDLDGVWREELLTLSSDSAYRIERIHPQGGFEVVPQTGHWKIKGTYLYLLPDPGFSRHVFKRVSHGLTEPAASRKDLRKVVWEKES